MTAHTNDSGGPAVRVRRPRWLLPVLVVAVLAIALVMSGFLSASTVLYAFAIGGMLLMHAGGHGGHGSDQAAPAPEVGEDGPAEAADERRTGGGCH